MAEDRNTTASAMETADIHVELERSLRIKQCGIYDLPAEILASIFSLTHSCALSSKETRFMGAETILRLSRVCSFWRETCLTFSALWSHIHIIDDSEGEMKMAEMFLRRSGSVPLTIDFRAQSLPPSLPYPEETRRILVQLFAECRRWKKASFPLTPNSLEQIYSAIHTRHPRPGFYFPLLESLTFTRRFERRNSFLDIFNGPGCTPKLHALAISDYEQFLPFSFDRITSLTFSEMRHTLPDLSRLCPRLQELKLSQRYWGGNEAGSTGLYGSSPELPRLRTLAVTSSGSGRVWDKLTLPSLHSLEIIRVSFLPLEHVSLISMLRRGECGLSLRRLSLLGTVCNEDDDLEKILSLTSFLEELVLSEPMQARNTVLTPKFLRALKAPPTDIGSSSGRSPRSPSPSISSTAESSPSHLIPNLRSVDFTVFHEKFPLEVLSEMLATRIADPHHCDATFQPSSGPLKHVRLCFILDKDSSPGKVPFDLAKMVNKLRLTSTADIQAVVQYNQWHRIF